MVLVLSMRRVRQLIPFAGDCRLFNHPGTRANPFNFDHTSTHRFFPLCVLLRLTSLSTRTVVTLTGIGSTGRNDTNSLQGCQKLTGPEQPMSFSKAQDLIRLAQMAVARRSGVSLEDICDEFSVSHRTAQRMTDALEATFGNVVAEDGDDRKRRWYLRDTGLSRLQLRHETGAEALEIAARSAEAEGRLRHAKALADLRDGMLARVPARARIEADAEAVLMAMGKVTRPGPRVSVTPDILDAIIEALRGPFRLRVRYSQDTKKRILEPHGVLLGHRTYLAARDPAKADEVRNFRIDLIPHYSPSRLGGALEAG